MSIRNDNLIITGINNIAAVRINAGKKFSALAQYHMAFGCAGFNHQKYMVRLQCTGFGLQHLVKIKINKIQGELIKALLQLLVKAAKSLGFKAKFIAVAPDKLDALLLPAVGTG